MPNINDLMPSKYLKQADVTPPKIVTIRDVKMETFEDKGVSKKKAVIYFEEVEKGLAANKTNLKRCAKFLASEDTDDWIGKKIKIYFDEEVEYGGEMVGGIRVGAAKRMTEAAAERAPAGVDPDDIPF